ncbi:MAG: type I restriction enzyme HsdR N-terminal domain-containing protein [Chitinophagales bacterium]|nr:type I restriction enzyme HsdR N-terminal domain-containing protein [Bacteroidota bacterium]
MPTAPKIKIENNVRFIWCIVRKKWIQLTPEENVRQYILHQFVDKFQFPLKYISVEKMFEVIGLKKRYDIVVFNQALQAKILVECKAENIEINDKTLRQISIYNLQLKVPYLLVSNGKKSFYFEIKNDKINSISTFPTFENL